MARDYSNSVIDLFEEQAEANSEKIAVVGSGKKYTYKALNERANSVANTLISLGIKQEERVLIVLPRVIDNYVANLGILKAGGAFVNASPSYPADRVLDIFEQAGCRFVITNKNTLYENAQIFKSLNVIPLLIEQLMSNRNINNPGIAVSKSGLCYVIFTSGSTGKPKGVMIEHGNLANFLANEPENTETYLIGRNGSVMLAMAQFTFDMSIMEEFLAFCFGMTLVLATEAEILDARLINDLLTENKVDALIVTPAYLNMLIDIPMLNAAIKSVKVMDFGAEAFPPALFTKIRNVNSDVLILNGYGPTEATISCTVKVIESEDDITIGFPNGNVCTYIVDDELNEVENGEEGELLICGKGVGRGYMNLPEQTAKSFITFHGMKAYRSGDFAIKRPDGDIEYRGRRDSQVKLRGLRIELGEIETVLGTHPDIKHCAAIVYDNKLLALYYSPSEESLDESKVREYLSEHLAHYLMPDVIVKIDEMPMTANQKIDRAALKKPDICEETAVLPSNEFERHLLDICLKFCPGMQESITANIINAGISSLELIGLIATIESEYMVRISIGDVFSNPTVTELEKFIKNCTRREVFRPKDRYPVSKSQMITYNDSIKRPDDMCWNLNYYYEMPLSIDPKRLAKSITGAFVIHPELLSTFSLEEGILWQIPADDELMYFPEIIYISDKEWEEMKPGLGKAFNITSDKLLFELCIYVTESKVILYVDFAHIIIDGDSLDIFLRDVTLLYEKKQIEPEEMSAYELIFEEEKQLEAFYNDCRNYYESLIDKNAQMRPISPSIHSDRLNPFIMRQLKTKMPDFKKICEKYNVSNNVIASGAFGYVLAKEEGLKESLHSVTYNNRSDSSLANTAGFLCKNLPMYCSMNEDMDWSEYLNMIKDQMRRNLIYPATAEQYMRDSRPEYVDNLVVFQSEMSDDFAIDGVTAKGSMVQHPIEATSFKIVLQLFPMGDMLMAVLVIDPKLYDEDFGNHFLDMLDETFESIMNDGETNGL